MALQQGTSSRSCGRDKQNLLEGAADSTGPVPQFLPGIGKRIPLSGLRRVRVWEIVAIRKRYVYVSQYLVNVFKVQHARNRKRYIGRDCFRGLKRLLFDILPSILDRPGMALPSLDRTTNRYIHRPVPSYIQST